VGHHDVLSGHRHFQEQLISLYLQTH
jgi:hypothetical protein